MSFKVGIIMGSESDFPVMKDAIDMLNIFEINNEVRIVSAHRTPELMFNYGKYAFTWNDRICNYYTCYWCSY